MRNHMPNLRIHQRQEKTPDKNTTLRTRPRLERIQARRTERRVPETDLPRTRQAAALTAARLRVTVARLTAKKNDALAGESPGIGNF